MIQSIMILTFFVSAPAATTDRTKKINDNEHTLQATRRWSDFWLSPSKRAAVISLSPSLPSTHRVAGRKSVLKLGKPVNEYDIIVDFSPSSPHPTTTSMVPLLGQVVPFQATSWAKLATSGDRDGCFARQRC